MSDRRTPSSEFWERRYREADHTHTAHPNAVLVDLIDELSPPVGTALDVGCGRGGDALWLAERGWTVTAVDVSATALAVLTDAARHGGVADRLTVSRHDAVDDLPAGVFDLVYACYLHSPIDIPRDGILRRAARAVPAGGLLMVVDHASTAPWSWSRDPAPVFPTPEETYRSIGLDDEWRAEVLAARRRVAIGPTGQTASVVDNVIVARRRDERPA